MGGLLGSDGTPTFFLALSIFMLLVQIMLELLHLRSELLQGHIYQKRKKQIILFFVTVYFQNGILHNNIMQLKNHSGSYSEGFARKG